MTRVRIEIEYGTCEVEIAQENRISYGDDRDVALRLLDECVRKARQALAEEAR